MLKAGSSQQWTRSAKFLCPPLLAFLLLQLNVYFPFLRFSSDAANLFVGALAFLLPFLAAVLAFMIPKRWFTTILLMVVLAPLLGLSALGVLFEGALLEDTLRTGVNPAFERIATVPMGVYSVGIFLSDCGAPCSMDIALRQEKAIAPGVLLVRELAGFEDADQPTYKVIDQDTLLINVPPYIDEDPRGVSIPARSRIYHLRPSLYF